MTTSDREPWPRTLADCHIVLDAQHEKLVAAHARLALLERGMEAAREEALREARAIVRAAPTLTYGERYTEAEGCFPAVEDSPAGDGRVYCTYGLRDAMLMWIDQRLDAIAALSDVGERSDDRN